MYAGAYPQPLSFFWKHSAESVLPCDLAFMKYAWPFVLEVARKSVIYVV